MQFTVLRRLWSCNFDVAFGMGCSPSILSSLSKSSNNRKDSGLYCSNGSDSNSNNKIDIHSDSNTSTALANQILVQSAGRKDVMEKVGRRSWIRLMFEFAEISVELFDKLCNTQNCQPQSSKDGNDASQIPTFLIVSSTVFLHQEFMKKDSIVTVSNFGHITNSFTIIPSTIRRATIGSKLHNNFSFRSRSWAFWKLESIVNDSWRMELTRIQGTLRGINGSVTWLDLINGEIFVLNVSMSTNKD
jgi:hypothetical protein